LSRFQEDSVQLFWGQYTRARKIQEAPGSTGIHVECEIQEARSGATSFLRTSVTILCSAAVIAAAEPAPYIAQQAEAGKAAYRASCASCHLPDLSGRNEAPQLSGRNFMNAWGSRTTTDLFTLIQTTMPPGRGGLDEESALNLTAFLLAANGASAGARPLT